MATWSDDIEREWERDCLYWRKRALTGKYRHWCFAYDGLPVDETCEHEWPCECAPELQKALG